MTAELPPAVTVLDANTRPPRHYRREALAWMQRQGIDVESAHRVEVFLLDTPFARVYGVERNADGSFVTKDGEYVECRRDVILAEMPPRLDGAA